MKYKKAVLYFYKDYTDVGSLRLFFLCFDIVNRIALIHTVSQRPAFLRDRALSYKNPYIFQGGTL